MPFGLPQRPPDPMPLIDVVENNAGDLQVVVSALASDMGRTVTQNQALIADTIGAVRGKLSRAKSANARDIETVLTQLGAALTSAFAVNQGEIDTVATTCNAGSWCADSDNWITQHSEGLPPPPPPPPIDPALADDAADNGGSNPWDVTVDPINQLGGDDQQAVVLSATLSGSKPCDPATDPNCTTGQSQDFDPLTS